MSKVLPLSKVELPKMYLYNFISLVRPDFSDKDTNNALKKLNANNSTHMLHFFKNQIEDALAISNYLGQKLLIVRKQTFGQAKCNLYTVVYDSRFYHSNLNKLSIWLLVNNEIHRVDSLMDLHPLTTDLHYRHNFPQKLADIFQLEDQSIQDPTVICELYDWLETHLKNFNQEIVLYHVFMYKKKCENGYFDSKRYGNQLSPNIFYLEIICDTQYQLAFRHKDPRHPKELTKNRRDQIEFEKWEEIMNMRFPNSLKDAVNRSCSVSTPLPVLSLAETLGIINEKEAETISKNISTTILALSCQYDVEKHLRYVYFQCKKKSFGLEINCFDKASDPYNKFKLEAYEKMNQFFQSLYETIDNLVKLRENILGFVLKRLESYPLTTKSHYGSCYKQFQQVIAKQLVLLYCENDETLQKLKFFIAHYIETTRTSKKNRVLLKLKRDNTIIGIVANNTTFFNIKEWVNCPFNDFYGTLDPSPCLICHTKLKTQSHLAQVKKRSKWLAQGPLTVYQKIRQYIYDTFQMDPFIKGQYKSLSMAGYELTLIKSTQMYGPLEQGIEKTKAFYHDLYRASSKGGIMISSFQELKVNQPLNNTGGQTAKSLYHYDLNSAYGYSASTCHLPNGFAVGYVKPFLTVPPPDSFYGVDKDYDWNLDQLKTPNSPKIAVKRIKIDPLQRQDKYRHQTFEFQAVYTTIFRLMEKNFNIKAVFHNFSTNGIFYINKYPLDLAVMCTDGKLLAFNFDGQYYHGCTICKPLKKYVNGLNMKDICLKTKQRDVTILEFCSQHPNAIYQTFTDCHDSLYKKQNLHSQMMSEPKLKKLINNYPNNAFFNKNSFIDYVRDNRHNDEYTFISWIHATTLDSLLIVRRDSKPTRDELTNFTPDNTHLIMTRQYLEFLLDTGNLVVKDVDAVIFYQTRKKLNVVFEKLVLQRYATKDLHLNCFMKCFINLSCGQYGRNTQLRLNVAITSTIPKNYKLYKHQIDFNLLQCSENVAEHNYFHLKTICTPCPRRPQCKVPLPWFVCIIEHSKLRLIQCLNFLTEHLGKNNLKLIYSNVDNLVIALSGNTLTETILPGKEWSFITNVENFIYHEKLAGKLKQEFCYYPEDDWKLVTARTQHLIVISKDQHILKTSGINFSSEEEAYQTGLNMLKGVKTQIIQERRVNRILGIEKRTQTLLI